jgi:hypothetical protein
VVAHLASCRGKGWQARFWADLAQMADSGKFSADKESPDDAGLWFFLSLVKA